MLTTDDKQFVILLHLRGFSYSFIAKELNCSKKTIYRAIKKFRKAELFDVNVRKKREYKLTAQQTYKVLKYFIDNPFHTYDQCIKKLKLPVDATTIGNVLTRNKFGSFTACKKNFISMQNQIARLKFALKFRHWTDEWLNVVFMDEKTVQTYANGKVLVKRRVNERYKYENLSLDEKQNTRNKANIFGFVSFEGPNKMHSVSTNFNGVQFERIMRKSVTHFKENSIILMDNAKIHNKGKQYLRDSEVTVLDFPAKSNDLNIIENIWAEIQKKLNRKLRNITVSSKDQLLKLVAESWGEVPTDFIKNCILSMPKRMEEVIRVAGKPTRF